MKFFVLHFLRNIEKILCKLFNIKSGFQQKDFTLRRRKKNGRIKMEIV